MGYSIHKQIKNLNYKIKISFIAKLGSYNQYIFLEKY